MNKKLIVAAAIVFGAVGFLAAQGTLRAQAVNADNSATNADNSAMNADNSTANADTNAAQ